MVRGLLRYLFLVKEIKSRQGVLHFQRYRLIQTRWFALYVHRISASDEDSHAHDHPWSFTSLLLGGSYSESWAKSPHWGLFMTRQLKAGQVVHHDHTDVHKLTLVTPTVWSLVLTGGRDHDWGYQTSEGWIDHKTYRFRKDVGTLPD